MTTRLYNNGLYGNFFSGEWNTCAINPDNRDLSYGGPTVNS